jgi:hypothetical protein
MLREDASRRHVRVRTLPLNACSRSPSRVETTAARSACQRTRPPNVRLDIEATMPGRVDHPSPFDNKDGLPHECTSGSYSPQARAR